MEGQRELFGLPAASFRWGHKFNVPFSRGSRNCIGFALAQMELTLIVARLARRLDIRVVAGATKPRPVGMVVNRPQGGAPMHVRSRASPPTATSAGLTR